MRLIVYGDNPNFRTNVPTSVGNYMVKISVMKQEDLIPASVTMMVIYWRGRPNPIHWLEEARLHGEIVDSTGNILTLGDCFLGARAKFFTDIEKAQQFLIDLSHDRTSLL